jgi:hypothetical protein
MNRDEPSHNFEFSSPLFKRKLCSLQTSLFGSSDAVSSLHPCRVVGMARPVTGTGGDGLQIGRDAEKTSNKQSRAGSKWWFSSLEVVRGVSSL